MNDRPDEASLRHCTEVQRQFVEHIDMVKHFVMSLLPDPDAAGDIVQETFLTVTAKAGEFAAGSNFKAWVLTIARLKTYEVFRARKRGPCPLSPETAALLAVEIESEPPAELDALRQALRRCLGKLNGRARRMLERQYRDGWKPAAIAQEEGWLPETVYTALSRARQFLRECIRKSAGPDLELP